MNDFHNVQESITNCTQEPLRFFADSLYAKVRFSVSHDNIVHEPFISLNFLCYIYTGYAMNRAYKKLESC